MGLGTQCCKQLSARSARRRTLLVESSQVMCIYTGTYQLFPTLVLTEGCSPGHRSARSLRAPTSISAIPSVISSAMPCGLGSR